ncbi:MAG: hypothetical protein WCO38_01305 [Verrucomicrobiota bacterium]|jgi:hypothetical protein|nr:MAG: hypothetical protein DVB35_05255 [Verrucomicrobiota bacterium]
MAPKTSLLCLIVLSFLSAGCTTGTFSVNVPIAGGKMRQIQLGSKGPVHAEDEYIAIEKAFIQIQGATKVGNFNWAFKVKGPVKPISVKIEDMSDDEPMVMLSQSPIEIAGNTWEAKGIDITQTYEGIKWIYEIENSLRVYRFTITLSNGTTSELYEGVSYPTQIKEYLKTQMGLPATLPVTPKAPEQPVTPNF